MDMLNLDDSNAAIRAAFDKALASGRWTDREKVPVAIANKIYVRFATELTAAIARRSAGLEEESIPLFKISGSEFVRFLNAAGTITSNDVISEGRVSGDVAFSASGSDTA